MGGALKNHIMIRNNQRRISLWEYWTSRSTMRTQSNQKNSCNKSKILSKHWQKNYRFRLIRGIEIKIWLNYGILAQTGA